MWLIFFYYISDTSVAYAKGGETDFNAKMEEIKQNMTRVELYLVRTHFLYILSKVVKVYVGNLVVRLI